MVLKVSPRRKTERIPKDIVTVIGCYRPKMWTEREKDAVCLSIAKDVVTIIGCSRPESLIEKGGEAQWAQPITSFLPPSPSLLLNSETLYIS